MKHEEKSGYGYIIVTVLGLVTLLCGCDWSPLQVTQVVDGSTKPTATPTSVQTDTGTTTATVSQTATPTVTDTGTDTSSATVTANPTATATDTATNTDTVTRTTPFQILSVTVDKVDALGNSAEDVRSFGIKMSGQAAWVYVAIYDKLTDEFVVGTGVAGNSDFPVPSSVYISPGNWNTKLESNTAYTWVVTANSFDPDPGSHGPAAYTGEFTTSICFAGQTRHCYSGPDGTENIGRCNGSTQSCVATDNGPQWDVSCVGEVIPYPWGDFKTFGNYVDDDCDGTINEGKLDYCADSGVTLTCCASAGAAFEKRALSQIVPNQVIKGTGTQFTYLFAKDGKRNVFPNREAVNSWYMQYDSIGTGDLVDFCRNIYELSDADLSSIPIGGNVTIRPGTYIVKFDSDPTIYVVSRGRTLRRLASADLAEQIYPGTSAARTRVISEAFFTNYGLGPDVVSKDDYDPLLEWEKSVPIETEIGSR